MDTTLAKKNMIQRQMWEEFVLDNSILELFQNVPREFFVPQNFHDAAFADMQIPIGNNQIMMRPNEQAKMLEALKIKPTDIILEVGTGTGYITALLSQLGKHIYSIDIFPDFIIAAEKKLAATDNKNVTLSVNDAAQSIPKNDTYDVIILTANTVVLPQKYAQALNPGGRLFAILGEKPTMSATLITRESETNWSQKSLFGTDVPQLINKLHAKPFSL